MLTNLRNLLICGIVCAAATGCDAGRTAGTPDRAAIDQLQSQIASSTGYEAYSVEVLASAVHLLVSISDRDLARSDEAERERVVNAVVATVEQAIATDARLATVEEISVAVVHPEGVLRNTHTEDVVNFRKGPNQRFQLDVL